jgi:P-aminobenzoate N-oxygenase AurF
MTAPASSTTVPDEGACPPPAGYDSAFGTWDRRASVRSRPRRVLDDGSVVGDGGQTALFFPPELVPAARHPLVAGRGGEAVHRTLVRSLYQYLHFTQVLEQVAVIPVTTAISLGRSGVEMDARMRADAFAITTDEAWHAQFSHDFIGQVHSASGVPPLPPEVPAFVHRLAEIRCGLPPDARRLVDLFFAVVSETLISSILTDIPHDRRLPAALRELVTDHAADEGRHHAFFRGFLRVIWPQLDTCERRLIGPLIPELVRAFAEPDLRAVAAGLRAEGLSQAQASRVVGESYHKARSQERIAQVARATVGSFADVGALDEPATRAAFVAHGLAG